MADEIFAINVGGYIGASTLLIIPVRGYRESGNMETVDPALWKP